ncbi:MAG: glycosyltransferase family 2 protein [Synechococcaceae bacterium WB9_2_170]|nr:glycosyltransferase family 2 protein [Synechococcaceae bacterium WB9_2_170]
MLLLNNDVEALQPGWLEAMAAQALRPCVGAVGAVLLYPDSNIQHAGVQLGFGRLRNSAEHAYRGLPLATPVHRNRAPLRPAVTGACLMVQRAHWGAVGGLDERLPVEFNDVAFCLSLLERGLRNLVEPAAQLIHYECQSRVPENSPTAEAALLRVNRCFPQFMQASSPWWPGSASAEHTDGRPRELADYG